MDVRGARRAGYGGAGAAGGRTRAQCAQGVGAAMARPVHHAKNSADSTKLNISTSSEALTTARVVAIEVPSIVGSAW